MLPTLGVGLLALSAILLGLIWPGVVQRFQVSPSEADKEAPYIEKNIDATRAAYDVENVEESTFTSSTAALSTDIDELDAATASVPLVDPQLVRATFEQLQQVRAYYSVAPVLDVDRYGERRRPAGARARRARAAAVRPRRRQPELVQPAHRLHPRQRRHRRLRQPARRRRRQPAHRGAVGRGRRARPDGADRPAAGALRDPRLLRRAEPGVLHRRQDDPDGKAVELDLPRGDRSDEDNQTTSYDGEGGVSVGGLFNKLLYATKFGEPNLVLSSRGSTRTARSSTTATRATMVEKVAPWLTVDADPYPAVIDGRIQWILDGYTTTDQYPLSQRESLETMTDDSLQRAAGLPDAADRRDQLHAQRREGDGRRVRRHRDALRVGRGRPDPQGVALDLPGRRQGQGRDVRRPDGARALPRGPLQGAALPVRPLPRHRREATGTRATTAGRSRPTPTTRPTAAAAAVPALRRTRPRPRAPRTRSTR